MLGAVASKVALGLRAWGVSALGLGVVLRSAGMVRVGSQGGTGRQGGTSWGQGYHSTCVVNSVLSELLLPLSAFPL